MNLHENWLAAKNKNFSLEFAEFTQELQQLLYFQLVWSFVVFHSLGQYEDVKSERHTTKQKADYKLFSKTYLHYDVIRASELVKLQAPIQVWTKCVTIFQRDVFKCWLILENLQESVERFLWFDFRDFFAAL